MRRQPRHGGSVQCRDFAGVGRQQRLDVSRDLTRGVSVSTLMGTGKNVSFDLKMLLLLQAVKKKYIRKIIIFNVRYVNGKNMQH